MGNIVDTVHDPAKIMLIGENGTGKTGAKAALVCEGYKLRIIDTDKGVRTLRSLLLDPRYPYKALIDKRKIDLREAVSYVPISINMGLETVKQQHTDPGGRRRETSEVLLAPKDAKAWQQIITQLENWEDPPKWDRASGTVPAQSYGHFSTWGPEVILDFDTWSTMSMMAYYYIQQLQNRLGARDDGYDYQRDVGAAQSQLRRMLEMIHADYVKCNVIITSHITRVDQQSGAVESPEQRMRNNRPIDAKGFPAAIGRALSPQMGKYVSDVYVVSSSGSGASVQRKINTVPTDNINAKNSVYLEREYSVETGLAEIFAALRGMPAPDELMAAVKAHKAIKTTTSPVNLGGGALATATSSRV